MFSAPFGLCFFAGTLMPSQIGYQDIASLVARQPAVTAHWNQHIRTSAFGTIHAATFSFARPVGTTMPQPLSIKLASLDPSVITLPAWDVPAQSVDDPPLPYPQVDRSAKGDRQPVLHPPERKLQSEPPVAAAPEEKPAGAEQATTEPVETAERPADDAPDPVEAALDSAPEAVPILPPAPMTEIARLYFGNAPIGDEPRLIEKWAPGEEPTIVEPVKPVDPDIKQSALDPAKAAPDADKGGETVVRQGEQAEGKRMPTPAERLKLDGKPRAVAEKCLADAIYFESRGEPVRGQIAVAQVVMNRVFSGYYPRSVCGTVYQNKHRRFACQFTFACDGIPDIVTEPNAWVRATRIARDMLDGKYWLPEVDRATHYHAYWVRPSWVREMKRLYKIGVHTFYRPRAWGDGHDVQSWGSTAATNEAIAKL